MHSPIFRLAFNTLKAQQVLCEITCAALERKLYRTGLTPEERSNVFHLWEVAIRDNEAAGDTLAVLGQDEQQAHLGDIVNTGFKDRTLRCVACGADFLFTADEQLFYRDKQFQNDPKRCKECRAKSTGGNSRARTEARITCSACGTETTVPFTPTQDKPVLCRSCFQKRKGKLLAFIKPGETPKPGGQFS